VSAAPEEVRRHAPAKVNLSLDVHGRRSDGYHELSTWMLALDWGDSLELRRAPRAGIELELGGPAASADVPADASNLVVRAAGAALERARELGLAAPAGLALRLHKEVPSRAGLGGGSSDAVAALLGVEELVGGDLGLAWKRRLCAELGADCSFFLEVGPSALAHCTGIGERVRPWSGAAPGWGLAVLVPEPVCPTGRVFEALAAGEVEERTERELSVLFTHSKVDELRAQLHTDLEAAALAAVPELRPWREWLDRAGAGHFRLTGSGSAFFGLFDDPEAAARSLAHLQSDAEAKELRFRDARVARPATVGDMGVARG